MRCGFAPVIATSLHDAEAEAAALITDTIDIVRAWVAAIAGHGTLTGEKLDAVIAAGVAERSIKREQVRREDRRRREQSALTFLTDGFPARSFDRIEKPLIP
jgi:hypothetical protein